MFINCVIVSVGRLHAYAISNMNNDGSIVKKCTLNTQFDIVTAQTCTERTRQEQERRDVDRLPTKKEMRQLTRGVEEKLVEYSSKKTSSFTYTDYLQYAKYIIVHVGVYNLRRSGEIAAMSLKQFEERAKVRKLVVASLKLY